MKRLLIFHAKNCLLYFSSKLSENCTTTTSNSEAEGSLFSDQQYRSCAKNLQLPDKCFSIIAVPLILHFLKIIKTKFSVIAACYRNWWDSVKIKFIFLSLCRKTFLKFVRRYFAITHEYLLDFPLVAIIGMFFKKVRTDWIIF